MSPAEEVKVLLDLIQAEASEAGMAMAVGNVGSHDWHLGKVVDARKKLDRIMRNLMSSYDSKQTYTTMHIPI